MRTSHQVIIIIIIAGFIFACFVSFLNSSNHGNGICSDSPQPLRAAKIQEKSKVEKEVNNFPANRPAVSLPLLRHGPTTIKELYRQKLQNCLVPDGMTEDDFYAEVHRAEGCKLSYAFGGLVYNDNSAIAGHKVVCMDEPFKPARNNCTVLSFGIYDEWSFDDATSDYGCKVYAFDPFNGLKEHKRGENIHFYPIGISDTNEMYKKGPLKGTPFMMTYRRVLEFLNLVDATIDYLKVDIEYSEVKMFNNIFKEDPELLANVKHIGMEIHPAKDQQKRRVFFAMMHKLRCLSFRKIFHETNPVTKYKYKGREEGRDYEMVWVNEAWLEH